jgi:hypothetical protein
MVNQAPSKDPANDGSLAGTFRQVFRKLMQSTDGMLPATVIAADRDWATVRPQIMVLGTDGSLTRRAQIARVPIFAFGAGGFVLSFPVLPGDPGWIIASDRDISLYLQAAEREAGPNTQRLHSFEDGLFVPDAARKYALAGEDVAAAVWQSLDGAVRVALHAGKVKITAPLVEIDAPLATFSGDVTVTGTVTGATNVLSGPDNISGIGHTHGGVQPGAGSTGAPNA